METIECSKCGAIFEKTGAKDKLRRFKDKRFMTTFHCPNCDARVILKNGDEPISIYLKRLERLKEQARRLGDRQEVNELQDEIDQINREIKMNAGKTKDKKFSMKDHGYVVNRIGSYEIIEGAGVDGGWWYAKERKGRPPLETKKFKTRREAEEHARMSTDDAAYDPTKPKNIAKAKALSVAQGKAASDAKVEVKQQSDVGSNQWGIYVDGKLVEGGFFSKSAAEEASVQYSKDEAYDPLDPENIAEEKELAKARGVAAADAKSAIITVGDNNWDIIIMDSTHIKMSLRYSDGKQNFGIPLHINQLSPDFINALKAKGLIKGNYFVEDSKTKDSLFKGQKVTAIKSEQGLREGETYTVLGEEEIIKQIVGEGNAIVYKLQDSSGNVIVIENPEGLFYEVKDSLIPVRQNMSSKEVEYKVGGQWKPIEGKVKAAYENDQIKYDRADGGYHYYTCEVKDSKTKDNYRSEQAYDEGYKAGREGKGINANPYSDVSKSGYADLHDSWQDGWKSGKLNSKATDSDPEENESLKVKIGDIKKNMDAARKMGYDTEPYQKEIDKLETKDDKELKEMLVNDAPDYYGAIVATARRGNNPRMGGAELRKNIEPFMTAHGVQFNEEEFNKAYKEFSHAGVSKAAFMKGTDAKTKDALIECMECGKKFKKNLSPNTFEVKCPKCGGYDVEVISGDSSDFYTKDPLTKKGQKILAAMQKVYGEEKGKQVFYASKSKGTISGVDGKTKDEEVHLSGSINKDKSVIDRLLKFWEGQYSGQTDKGAIFKFKNESDANGFRKDIKKQVFSVFVDSKTKDQEIKIIIGEDPTSPSPAEQKVEGNDVIYKEYTLKQLPETGEFEIYAPGGSIVGHAKALELAKLFVDRIVASRVGDEWSEEARKKL